MNRFYFDHNATTPVSDAALETWVRVSREAFGNASSIHQAGQAARRELDAARAKVAALLGADAREIVFTSGGTEADNLALLGTWRARGGGHVVTTAIEHPAVLQAAAQLEREGAAVTYVQPDPRGVVSPCAVRNAMRDGTVLVSVMHVNNDLGTVQPVAEIAAVARGFGALMHSDGVQAAGRIDCKVRELGVDLYSVSGHKTGAPKGTGALYVRRDVKLTALQFGGRHEGGRRAGTENVAGAAAMGTAAETVSAGGLRELRDRFEAGVLAAIPDVRINGRDAERTPNTSSVCLEGIEGEAVVIAMDLRGFSISSGAACSSGAVEPSHVLTAIGLSRRDAKSCIRVSMGAGNTAEAVDQLVEALADVTRRLRNLSSDYRGAHA